eukprot:scaffold15345_cov57-Cylindrotheca_fusiformis.AAC.1
MALLLHPSTLTARCSTVPIDRQDHHDLLSIANLPVPFMTCSETSPHPNTSSPTYLGAAPPRESDVEDGQRCTGGRRRRRASIRAECIGGVSLFSFNDHDGERVDHPSSLSLQMSKKYHPPSLA